MRTASRLAALLLCLLHLPVSGQQPATWRLVPELRIGSLDDPKYSLTAITDVEVDASDRIFVAQSSEQTVRVFDERGTYLYEFGGQGGGPGEFRRVNHLLISPSGLLVVDESQPRLSLFRLDGTFVNSWRQLPPGPDPDLVSSSAPQALLSDGMLIGTGSYRQGKHKPQTEVPLIAADTGECQFRVMAMLTIQDKMREAVSGDFSAVIPQPVSSSTLFAYPRDMNGVILVHRTMGDGDTHGEVHVVHLTSTGDTILSRRYRIPAEEVPASAVQDSLEGLIQRAIKRAPFPADRIRAMLTDGWHVPPYQAPVDRLVAGIDGTIWLRRGAFGLDTATWWALDEQGNILATLRVPTSLKLHRASADRVWATQRGEYDEPYVVRMRVVRP